MKKNHQKITAWMGVLSVAAALAHSRASASTGDGCVDHIGSRAASVLVKDCLNVAMGSHPPCNQDNPCELLTESIVSSCKIFEKGKVPKLCISYLNNKSLNPPQAESLSDE